MITIITNRKQIMYTDLVTHLIKCVHPTIERIILREKDLPIETIQKKIKQIKACSSLARIPLLLNGPYSIGETFGADGRHYTMDQYKALRASNLKVDFKIGVSVHSMEEITYVNRYETDYILYGHIFPTACKAGLHERGVDNLKLLMGNAHAPIVALGGITEKNYRLIQDKGCFHFALMSSVMQNNCPNDYLDLFSVNKQ